MGSVRAVVNPAGVVSEKNDYYPFGLRHANASLPISAANRFKFNGKEEQIAGNLALLDYGARMYDNVLGRWTAGDPLAEKYYPVSPYGYVRDNPIMRIDPNGMQDGWYLDLYDARIRLQEDSKDLFEQAQIYLAAPDASVGDIENALSERNYEFRKDASVEGGFRVDTEKQYKGWATMQVLSPENVGAILGMSMGSGFGAAGERGAARAAANAGNLVEKGAGNGRITVVGEGMKRVSMEAAKHSGSITLNNMPQFSGNTNQITSQMMYYNRQWLLQQMRSGGAIIDIGLDPARTNPSIFYQMEQNMMGNYLKLHPNAVQIIRP